MDLTWLLILVIVSAVVALAVLFVFRRKPESAVEEAAADYAEGLNLLLVGAKEEALQKFTDSVRKNSKNVDAYLKIGDIYREFGKADKAINVHKYLTVRRGLTPKKQLQILQSLAMDYHAGKRFDQALEVVDRILDEDKHNVWAQEMKLQLYEEKEDWQKAFDTYKDLLKLKKSASNGKLALYKVQEGLQLLKDGDEKEARARFRDAIKIAPASPPAYIYLADSYLKENRKEEALKTLKRFIEKVPAQSFLAFERIKNLLFESGVYGEIENLYREIIESQPSNVAAHLALSEIYEKKGELEKAIDTCREVIEQDPNNKVAKKYLVRYYHVAGRDREAVELALEIIDESLHKHEIFTCKVCGYESEEPFWRCPNCHEWETFVTN